MNNVKNVLKSWIFRLKCWIFGGEESVDYIDRLPTPLSQEEETDALIKMEQGDIAAKDTLIEHNLRLVVYIAKRFDNTGHDMDELVSVGTMGLMKAVKSYSRDKNIKLATYASRCIENEILMFLRKMVKTRQEVSLDEPLNVDWEGNQLVLSDVLGSDPEGVYKDMENDVEMGILRDLYEKLDDRDKKILGMRYGLYGAEEKTQKEIADMMNISQSYISRLEKKILKEMRKGFLKAE